MEAVFAGAEIFLSTLAPVKYALLLESART